MCEPHNSSVVHVGPSGATAVPGETWASLGNLTKKLMVHPGVHCIFEGRRGPKRRGTQGNLPLLPPLSTGLSACKLSCCHGDVTVGCRAYDREVVGSTPGRVVTTRMGDYLQTGKQSRYITNHQG